MAQHADRFHGPDELVHGAGGKEILADLVRAHAEPGFLDGGGGEILGVLRRRFGHRGDDPIDLRLVEVGESGLGVMGARGKTARFFAGAPIEVGQRIEVRHGGGGRNYSRSSPAAGRIFSTS